MSSLAETFRKLNEGDLDLDLENIGSWPMPAKVVACIFVFGVVLFLGYYLHLSDLNDTLTRAQKAEQDLKQEFKLKAHQAANLVAYREQMQELEVSFGAMVNQLPSDTEVPGLLEDMTSKGLSAGLVINAITLQPEVTHEFYIELPIKVSVRGDYHDLGNFVSGVAGLHRIVTLHNFSIKKSKDSSLTMEILARTYRYNDKGGSK